MNSGTSPQHKSPPSAKPLCRYFASNICYKGDACEFSHERNAKPDLTCRYYLAGHCAFGNHCRYDHVRPQNKQENLNAKSSLNSSAGKASTSKSTQPLVLNDKNASIPEKNPWKVKSPLGNFHQNMAQELELISHNQEQPAGTSSTTPMMLADIPLCPYFEVGLCGDGEFCRFLHGLACDMCGLNVLHPHNQTQRVNHHRACLAEHEKQMEAAFAEARSAEKNCGICMEQIVEKGLRFGILQSCTHCYCLDCIRKWRRHNDDEINAKTVRACPECRVHSDYVIPSKVWIEDRAEKERLASHFKENTKKIPCKYVVNGDVDKCPFGNKCFYKHQLPDGTIVEGKSPTELRKNRRRTTTTNLYEFLVLDNIFDLWDSDDDFDDSDEEDEGRGEGGDEDVLDIFEP